MKCGHDGGGVVTFNDEQDVIHLAHVGRDCGHVKCGHDGGGVVTFNDEQDVIHLAHVGRDCVGTT